MQALPLTGDVRESVLALLAKAPVFRGLRREHYEHVLQWATGRIYEEGERVCEQGEAAEHAFVILAGELDVVLADPRAERHVATMRPGEVAGIIGLLVPDKRSAALVARGSTRLLVFARAEFDRMVEKLPAFGAELARHLADRLRHSIHRLPLRDWTSTLAEVEDAALALVPFDFMSRHRLVPLSVSGRVLVVGFTNDPTPRVLEALAKMLPSIEIHPVRILPALVDEVLVRASGATKAAPKPDADLLDLLLRRMVGEAASDLHLSAGQAPRWRVHARMTTIAGLAPLGPDDVLRMFESRMPERVRSEFAARGDCDFAVSLPGVARFRVNLFRNIHGVSSVARQIPDRILSTDQLGLPDAVRKMADHPKGLVLVAGPTGSGKSTTLAALVDQVNRTRAVHIVTLEDPVEFVHPSKQALVNQREIGTQCESFARGLRAALREDPDVVLVGELRDLETTAMALETANTGHLVFGTLHTNSAMSTVERIVDLFPAEQQDSVRASLADVLRGVVCQVLCRKKGGGRVAAMEILVPNAAIANLVREKKTFQVASVMQTGQAQGQRLMNADLARLVAEGTIEPAEALEKTSDRADLAKRMGMSGEMSPAPALAR
jgi:twitching motility protein PilT